LKDLFFEDSLFTGGLSTFSVNSYHFVLAD